LSSLSEELMDRVTQYGCLIWQTGLPIKIDNQGKGRIARYLFRPVNNKLLSLGFQIPFAEWRRINGIEKLF